MMLKKTLALMIVAVAVVGLASLAQAALVNTSHNIILHQSLSSGQGEGPCSFCHTPHGAQGDKLFPTSVTISGITSQWANDGVAKICWSCHGAATTYTHPRNVMPFQAEADGAHARDVDELVTWGDVSAVGDISNVYGYSNSASRTPQYAIGCESCHDPHDNTTRPFWRNNSAVTGDMDLTEGDALSLCDDCHRTRWQNANTGTRVNHPTNDTLADVANVSNLYEYTGGSYSNRFNSTYTSDFTIQNTSNTDYTEKWNLGGKFRNDGGTSPATISGHINCGTCHMVHSNETNEAGYAVNDGLVAGATQSVATTIGDWPWDQLLVLNPNPITASAGTIAPICSGCHDISIAAQGPGGTGYSHPYNSFGWDDADPIIDVATMAASPYFAKFGGNNAATRTIVCQSCHDMHYSRLQDTAVVNYSMLRATCDECHGAGTGAKDDHHPSNVDVTYGTDLRNGAGATDPPLIGASMNWAAIETTGNADVNANDLTGIWTASANPYYFESSGGGSGTMVCATCHGGSTSGAHNNANAGMLAGDNAENTMCVDCHGLNPGLYTGRSGTDYAGTVSHWLGQIMNADYMWAGGDSSVTVDPLAGAGSAQWGSDSGTGADTDIICTSCHLILTDTYTTQLATNTGDNESSTADTIRLILTPSGNTITDAAANNDFLCTACHGATPGGGSTHPVQPTMSSNMGTDTSAGADEANDGVTSAANGGGGGITCESCHRPHNAASGSGSYILEYVDVSAGYMNQQALCSECHSK